MSESEARFAGRRVLALGGAQAAAIAGAFEGAAVQYAEFTDEAVRPRAGQAPVVTPAALVASRLFRDAHIVVATTDGLKTRAMFEALANADLSREVSRPVVVMIAGSGLPDRATADVLVFDEEEGRSRYQALAVTSGFDATNAVVARGPDHGALLDQCAGLLMGQDMRGSALPLRPVIEPLNIAPARGLIAGLSARIVRALRG